MNILKSIEQESGLEFLERISPRPRTSLQGLLPFFELPEDSKRSSENFTQKEVVEICGKEDSGKTCESFNSFSKAPRLFTDCNIPEFRICYDHSNRKWHFSRTVIVLFIVSFEEQQVIL